MPNEIIIKNLRGLKASNFVSSVNSEEIEKVAERFSVSITPSIVKSLKSNPESPLFSQYVPSADELNIKNDELQDPIGDDISTINNQNQMQ